MDFVKGINTRTVSLVRYSGLLLKGTREELKQMQQRTRKLMTMRKALNPRDDVDRLNVSRKEGGIRLLSNEHSVDTSIQPLEKVIQKRGRRWIMYHQKTGKKEAKMSKICLPPLPSSNQIKQCIMLCIGTIYQPLRSGRIWHKVNF